MNSAKTVNVSQVAQLSPFRYAGGKTWLVPVFRQWVHSLAFRPKVLIEPFAGGAIIGLTAAAENLADNIVLCELDSDVVAVWKIVFGRSNKDADWLFNEILNAPITYDYVRRIIGQSTQRLKEKAFRTIVKNRTQRGGILAAGAGLVKEGEGGKGLRSRWYPQTLVNRMRLLRSLRKRVTVVHGDAFDLIKAHRTGRKNVFFVDPPYTAGGKRAGARLYTHNIIDHAALFDLIANVSGEYLLTYDDSIDIIALAEQHNMSISKTPMKNTHHAVMYELLIKKRQTP